MEGQGEGQLGRMDVPLDRCMHAMHPGKHASSHASVHVSIHASMYRALEKEISD